MHDEEGCSHQHVEDWDPDRVPTTALQPPPCPGTQLHASEYTLRFQGLTDPRQPEEEPQPRASIHSERRT
eukprot:CAMPEP_0114269520 /NCGR_PEP_ID=MMETSP0058-20121206/26671_1 /TAXON_ID=36894 /ORGANISM="Pyramimonas parkeae, CCMP726" /LENGTH=69 /DNA_ID=CAMNT_0001388041 /DNA_START=325 /DNA_END=534 /DNA_ORIENTATION=+